MKNLWVKFVELQFATNVKKLPLPHTRDRIGCQVPRISLKMSKNTDKSIRSSNADYPVDPVERSNQEARLKKAAAAGASASSSPISALKFQLPSSSPASQKAAESQTTLSKPAASTESAPEALESGNAT